MGMLAEEDIPVGLCARWGSVELGRSLWEMICFIAVPALNLRRQALARSVRRMERRHSSVPTLTGGSGENPCRRLASLGRRVCAPP